MTKYSRHLQFTHYSLFILYALLAIFLTYPLSLNLTTAVPNDIGDPLLNTWILAWDSHALLTDPLNLFNANIFHPLPNTLAYSEHLISTAMLALPLQLFTTEPVAAYNLSLLFTFPLAAFGMYLLVLRWTNQRGAAFIAGLIFGFAPYRFAAIAHLQLLTFQWLPYSLLLLDIILTRTWPSPASKRHYLAFSIFLLLQILASWYLALYTGLIIVLYILITLIAKKLTKPKTHSTPPLPKLILTLIAIFIFTLPFAIPYLSLLSELQSARPLSLARSLAAVPTDYLAAVPFNSIFGPLTEQFRVRPGFTEENTLFVGIVAPVLALVALVTLFARNVLRIPYSVFFPRNTQSASRIIFLFIISTLSLALTFAMPYSTLAQLFSPTTIIRVPPRWIIPALFGLAGLAGYGAAIINYQLTVNNHERLKAVLVVACAALLLAEAASIPIPLANVENRATLNPAYRWLAQQPDAALIELPLHSAPAPEYPEVKRLYASTLGWWRLVNGYSGYTPPRQPQLAQALATFPDDQSIATLQNLAIHNLQFTDPQPQFFLLIHPGEAPFDRTQWETSDRWLTERNPALIPIGQFEGDHLYEILPPDPNRFTTPPLATFGNNIQLKEFATLAPARSAGVRNYSPPNEVERGSQLAILWQVDSPPPEDYTVFIHLRAADGFVRSQADSPPVSGSYPTSQWQPGEIIQDIHPLPQTEDYNQVDHIAVGLYNPASGERLPAFSPNGTRLPNDEMIVPLQ